MLVDWKKFGMRAAGTILTAAWSYGLLAAQEETASPAPTPAVRSAEETLDKDEPATDELVEEQDREQEEDDDDADDIGKKLDPAARLKRDCPSLTDLGYKPKLMSEISLDITSKADELPSDCSTELFNGSGHAGFLAADQIVFWKASELSYQPLYWEQARLERYGQSYGPLLQPVLSGAHFLCTFPIIPYKIGLDRPCDRIYSLGYFRPGSCAPRVRPRLPWEWDAALFQAGSLTGAILLLP